MTLRFCLEPWASRGTIDQDGEEPSLQMGQWRVLVLLESHAS